MSIKGCSINNSLHDNSIIRTTFNFINRPFIKKLQPKIISQLRTRRKKYLDEIETQLRNGWTAFGYAKSATSATKNTKLKDSSRFSCFFLSPYKLVKGLCNFVAYYFRKRLIYFFSVTISLLLLCWHSLFSYDFDFFISAHEVRYLYKIIFLMFFFLCNPAVLFIRSINLFDVLRKYFRVTIRLKTGIWWSFWFFLYRYIMFTTWLLLRMRNIFEHWQNEYVNLRF